MRGEVVWRKEEDGAERKGREEGRWRGEWRRGGEEVRKGEGEEERGRGGGRRRTGNKD